MRGVHLFVALGAAVVGVAYLVFSFQPNVPRPTAAPRAIRPGALAGQPDELVVGEPIVFQNLTIFPVSSKTPNDQDRFITLDEGLKAGSVEILEKAATQSVESGNQARPQVNDDPFAEPVQRSRGANEVNELMVVNRSEKPLYLMPGEIIVGGDQDRTIGEELVVAPDGKPVSLNVFCVEHARWGSRSEQDYADILAFSSTSDSISATTIAASDAGPIHGLAHEANLGKFIGSVGSLSKPARLAVQRGDGQSKVWEEVANENAKSKVEAATGTFTANYSDVESLERLRPYLEQLHDPIAGTENVVGVVVAVNGEMESLDVFQSTPLFKKLWPKLLKSYALDASNAQSDESDPKKATRMAATTFLKDIAQASTVNEQASGDLAKSSGESDRVLVFSAREIQSQDAGGPSMMGGMGGMGFGGAIHSSGYSK